MINILDKNTKLILAEPIDEAIEKKTVANQSEDDENEIVFTCDITGNEAAEAKKTIADGNAYKVILWSQAESEEDIAEEVKEYIEHEFDVTVNNIKIIDATLKRFNESIEDEILPDVTLDEPTIISTETEPEISPEVKDNAISTLINSGITTELNSIDDIKSYIATIEAEQPELTEVIEILKTISDEKTIIIGMYNTILDIIDPEHAELIKTGETKATEISDTEISEPSDEETETED